METAGNTVNEIVPRTASAMTVIGCSFLGEIH